MARCVTPSLLSRGRNINRLPIGLTFRLNLRFRLTHSRRTLLWNPWAFGVGDSHSQSLLMPTFLLLYAPASLTRYLLRIQNTPLPPTDYSVDLRLRWMT